MIFPNIAYLPLLGCCFYYGSHYLCRTLLTVYCSNKLDSNACYRISTKVISMVNAIFAVLVSCHTISVCDDIMKDKDPVMYYYIIFGLSYFVYDLYVMYVGQRLIDITNYHDENDGKTLKSKLPTIWDTVCRFFRSQGTIIVHHLVFTILGIPLVRMLRNKTGDYIVACFFLAELSTPFLSTRAILHEFKITNGAFYALNGVMFVVTFFIVRVVCVPFVYWRFAQYKNISIFEVPFMIPLHCNILSLAFELLQLYWFNIILKAFRRRLSLQSLGVGRPKVLIRGLKGLININKYDKQA